LLLHPIDLEPPALRATSVTDYAGLLEVIRRRMAELELTYELLDHLAGTQQGYANKILGPNPSKTLGRVSFASIVGALALKVTVSVDKVQAERMRGRWTPRRVRPAMASRAGSATAGESISPAAI
jgi:hypothetical protein